MRLLLIAMIAGACSLQAEPARDWTRQWAVSLATLATANAVDVHSSIGGHEANPLLRGSNGRFATGRGIALKVIVVGGVVLAQWLLSRRHPERRKAFALGNYALAGVTFGVAAHNYGVPR